MDPSDTAAFYASELKEVCQSQIYAVRSVGAVTSIPSSDSPSAEIEITLLEGTSIVVNLSLAGYRVVGREGPTFELLDYLLELESPMWSAKRMQILTAILEELSRQETENNLRQTS
ncbi:hypothetical protein BS47DRAFT_1341996 [Hydnum rufescens UP504]|uniref:GSKIP domain-containing protein n=1 Tax=Hydnum rufescens UP504 TaxID=1448309 RepID=A0A9P6B0N8_9AGAM|nr:hypothetical protein BS47DRAFT_1341996 [Hydnum rufescens UP504]